jgi:hypothetical protein
MAFGFRCVQEYYDYHSFFLENSYEIYRVRSILMLIDCTLIVMKSLSQSLRQ